MKIHLSQIAVMIVSASISFSCSSLSTKNQTASAERATDGRSPAAYLVKHKCSGTSTTDPSRQVRVEASGIVGSPAPSNTATYSAEVTVQGTTIKGPINYSGLKIRGKAIKYSDLQMYVLMTQPKDGPFTNMAITITNKEENSLVLVSMNDEISEEFKLNCQ